MTTPIARPYAEALVEIGVEKGVLETFKEDLEFVAAFLRETPEFHAFYDSPRIDRGVKRKVIRKAFGGRLDDRIVSLLELLVEKSRQFYLPSIVETFIELYDERTGRVGVRMTTARPIDEGRVRAVTERLTRILGKEVHLETELDPELLGGIVLHVGDTVVDGSLKSRLEALSKKMRYADLAGAGIYED